MHKFSRRAFMAGVAGTAAAGALPFAMWAGQQAKAQSAELLIRHDVSTPEGQAMLEKYAQAVAMMMDTAETPEADPVSWLFQWYTHALPGSPGKQSEIDRLYGGVAPDDPTRLLAIGAWNTCRAHGMTGLPEDEDDFLPWHRMYVYFHERIIRTVLGDDTFTLPYWDYTTAGKRAIPEQFRMPNDPLFGALFRDNRNDGSRPGTADVNAGEPIDQNRPGAVNLDALAQAEYQAVGAQRGFNETLDFGLHGAIHVLVGNTTNMGVVPWAARDPIFWMHHCNIDRLWTSWNAGGRQNPGGAWLTHSFVFADEDGNAVNPLTEGFVDNETIAVGPYSYDKLEPVPPVPPRPAAVAMMAATPAIIASQAQPGPVVLGRAEAISVPLAAAAAPLSAHMAAGPEGSRVHLVLQDVQTNVQPGILYDVFLDTASGEADGPSEPVGTVNFFGAETHMAEHAANRPPRIYSFDVTDMVAREMGESESAPTVRIAPAGAPEADATPVIGSISLVRQ